MKKRALHILLLLLISTSVFGQKNSNVDLYLSKLYQGFPLAAEASVIQKYLDLNYYVESPSMYDSTRTDYRKALNADSAYSFQPNSATIEYFYANGWGFGKQSLEHARITALTLNYGEASPKECHEQYKNLIKMLKSMTAKSESHQSYADAGKVGEGYKFYRNRKDKFPFLTVDLTNKSCTGTACYIFIAHIKQLEE